MTSWAPNMKRKNDGRYTAMKKKIAMASHSCPKEKAAKPAEKEGLSAFYEIREGSQAVCCGKGRRAAYRNDAVTVLHPSIPGAQPDTLFPELGAHTGL